MATLIEIFKNVDHLEEHMGTIGCDFAVKRNDVIFRAKFFDSYKDSFTGWQDNKIVTYPASEDGFELISTEKKGWLEDDSTTSGHDKPV